MALTDAARAQAAPAEGRDYLRLQPPANIALPAGQIDVVEFFSYACPHCNDFEPVLEPWVKKQPADVRFHRVPVGFLFNAENFQPLYYALEAMNIVDTMQLKVFNAVHRERQRLDKPDDIAAFMTRNGVDGAKFMAVFNSFSVRAKVQQVRQLMSEFHVEEVPLLGIQGRYLTSPSRARGEEAALKTADVLIDRVRKGQ